MADNTDISKTEKDGGTPTLSEGGYKSPMDLLFPQDKIYEFEGFPLNRVFNPEDHVSKIKNLELQKDDVMVCGYPKSGNVWTMTMINAINSSADLDRFENEGTPGTKRALEDVSAWEENRSLPHPAVYLSHNRYHVLPASVRRKQNKIVHITRYPKDVAVSTYHWINILNVNIEKPQVEFDLFLREYLLESKRKFMWGSWWEYMADWIQYKNEPHILFVQYEDMVKEPETMVSSISEFLGKQLSETQISRIAKLVSFDAMKENANLSSSIQQTILDTSKGSFMRKGKIGDWKNYFTHKQSEEFDAVFQNFVKETGWKPSVNVEAM